MAFKKKNHPPISTEIVRTKERYGHFDFSELTIKLGIGAFAATNLILPSAHIATASEVAPYSASWDESQPETENFVSMDETLTVATWNVYFGNMPENVRDSVMKLLSLKKIDVIGLQEVHNPETRRLLADSINCLLCDYAGYIENSDFEGSSKASLPFIWNKDRFDLESHGVQKVSDKVTGIDDLTGKDMSVSEKNIAYYILADKETGVRTRFFVTQTVASVESNGEILDENRYRIKLYKKHIKTMKELVAELNEQDTMPNVIIADQNIDANYDKGEVGYHPKSVASEMGFVFADDKLALSDRKLGTHEDPETGESRWIDHVLVSNDGRYIPSDAHVHDDKMGSDHRPLVTKLRVVNNDERPVDQDRQTLDQSEQKVAPWIVSGIEAINDRRRHDLHEKRPTPRGHV